MNTKILERFYRISLNLINLEPSKLLQKDIKDCSRIGYSDGGIKDKATPYIKELKELGLLNEKEQETFAGHLISPIYDFNDILCNLVGLSTDKEKPLLASAGIHNAKNCRLHPKLQVFETVRQALSSGADNAITFINGITEENLQILKSFGVTSLKFHYDNPEHKALCKVYFKIENEGSNTAYQLPDTLQSISKNSFIIVFDQREYQITLLSRQAGKLTTTVKAKLLSGSRFALDNTNFTSHLQRDNLAKLICRDLKVKAEDVKADILKLIPLIENYKFSGSETNPATMSEVEKQAAVNFAKSPDLIERIQKDLGLFTQGEELNRFVCYLGATSRLSDKPLAVHIFSTSGSGKSSLIENTLKFFPKEQVEYLSSLSSKALFYRKDSLNGKILFLEEMDGISDDYALRCLVSTGKLVSESTVRNPSDGSMGNQRKEIEAKASLFVTSTKALHPETESRLLTLTLDQSAEQTEKINSRFLKSRTLQALTQKSTEQETTRLHGNFHRLLQAVKIVHSAEITKQIEFDPKRIESRRNLPKYVALIDAIAFLRQYQKTVNEHEGTRYITADLTDLEYVREIAEKLFAHSLVKELSGNAQEMLGIIENSYGMKEQFTRNDLCEKTMFSMSKTKRTVSELLSFELIQPADSRKVRGSKFTLLKTLKEIS